MYFNNEPNYKNSVINTVLLKMFLYWVFKSLQVWCAI